MKRLYATADASTPASLERCFALLSTIDEYPRWFPSGIIRAELLECDGDGLPTRARALLHFAHGPLARQFPLDLSVITNHKRSIELRRMPEHPDDEEQLSVSWRLSDGADARRIEVEMSAHLAVPRFLPLGGVAQSVVNSFLDAAVLALARPHAMALRARGSSIASATSS